MGARRQLGSCSWPADILYRGCRAHFPQAEDRMTILAGWISLMALVAVASAQCTDGGGGGCSPPVAEKWDRWDMAVRTQQFWL